jgi:outer membrane murein-binding lipoprotein Lpp
LTVAAVVAGACLVAGPVQAKQQPSKAEITEAQRRFQRATELYEENNLPGALAEFRKAYSLAPNYRVLYNIGQLCFLMQDSPCAYGAFSNYLEQGGGEIPDKRREEVQRDLARLQARVARLRIVADKPGAEVTVDDVSVGTTPLSEPVLVAAGRPRVRVSLAGHAPVTRVVEVAGMETVKVDVHLVPTNGSAARDEAPTPPASRSVEVPTSPRPAEDPSAGLRPDLTKDAAPAESSSRSGLTAVGLTLGAVGLAGLAAGGLSSYKVHSLQREIETAKVGELTGPKLTAQQDQAGRYQSWQWVGYGAGTAVLAVGIVFLMMDGNDDSGERATGPRLIGSIGPGGTSQVALSGRF